jgi:acyl carrier protein
MGMFNQNDFLEPLQVNTQQSDLKSALVNKIQHIFKRKEKVNPNFELVVKFAKFYMNDTSKEITNETKLMEVLDDSLDLVEFAMDIEETVKTSIPDYVVESWKTIGDVVEYLDTHS